MGLIQRIKSVLGLGTSGPSQPGSTGREQHSAEDAGTSEPKPASEVESDEELESAQTVVDTGDDGVDVTVEHDPDAEAETDAGAADADAAEADASEAGTADVASEAAAEESTDEEAPATETEEAVKGTETDAGTDAALEDVKGIGPAYADRLRDAGVESVADLASADAGELAAESDIAESRIENWIDQAETF